MGPPGMETERRLSSSIIDAVASAEGVDPIELSDPLFTAIDPEALDRLFRAGTGEVTFEYLGYEVTVVWNGEVGVEPDVQK